MSDNHKERSLKEKDDNKRKIGTVGIFNQLSASLNRNQENNLHFQLSRTRETKKPIANGDTKE